MTFHELEQARELFGLTERATRGVVTDRFRRLVKESHPDLHEGREDDRIRAITAAYALLREYCDTYVFSFTFDEFLNQNPDERLRLQFSNDPLWGGR